VREGEEGEEEEFKMRMEIGLGLFWRADWPVFV
jgi:hypothetical protein